MLREQIGEETGKVAARWVLSVDGGAKVEGSFESTGKLLGVQVVRGSRTGRRSGQMEACTARCQGIVLGAGNERATFKAQGVGKVLEGGAVSYRGAQDFYSDSPKFGCLNSYIRRSPSQAGDGSILDSYGNLSNSDT